MPVTRLSGSLNWDYNMVVERGVRLSVDAVRQFRALRAFERSLLRDAMKKHLGESDPGQETRDCFRLRRPSEFADFELRVQDFRVFYRLAGNQVQVVLIGRKKGSELIVEGRSFVL